VGVAGKSVPVLPLVPMVAPMVVDWNIRADKSLVPSSTSVSAICYAIWVPNLGLTLTKKFDGGGENGTWIQVDVLVDRPAGLDKVWLQSGLGRSTADGSISQPDGAATSSD